MASLARWGIPALFLLVGFWAAFFVLNATMDAACSYLPEAFQHGMKTRTSDTLGVLASHCEVTNRATQVTVTKTIVNWSGIVAGTAICAGAWLTGAGLVGLVDRRRALLGVVVAASVSFIAAVVLFV